MQIAIEHIDMIIPEQDKGCPRDEYLVKTMGDLLAEMQEISKKIKIVEDAETISFKNSKEFYGDVYFSIIPFADSLVNRTIKFVVMDLVKQKAELRKLYTEMGRELADLIAE